MTVVMTGLGRIKQLRHDIESHRDARAHDFMGGILDIPLKMIADPFADEIVGYSDFNNTCEFLRTGLKMRGAFLTKIVKKEPTTL